MSACRHGEVPGQMSLLELLTQPSDRSDRNHPNDLVDRAAQAVGEAAGLGEWDRALLRSAAEHHPAGSYAERVEQQLGCNVTRYLQTLVGCWTVPSFWLRNPSSSASPGCWATAGRRLARKPILNRTLSR